MMIGTIIHKLIVSRTKEIPCIIFLGFLVTFIIARGSTWMMHNNMMPTFYIYITNIHVHHFSYGILLLTITGFIALAFSSFTARHRYGLAILYSIGLGVTTDEFAMWLLLEDNYWARLSYDAVLIITLLFLHIIYGKRFWLYIGRKSKIIRPASHI